MNFDFQDFLSFNKMITPTIIKIIFYIGVGISVLMGLFQIIAGVASNFGGGLQVIMGLITLVVGPLFVRIYCELLILFFKMHESLNRINKNLEAAEYEE
ncbi:MULTISPECIES: DUF4282 domain-containing protein [Bacillaceae]|uniref:DUF4282 domain-containing protein n=1 Tax=Evansella alkalicola TaxID=745819 RepID=A0ABS6K1R1_9BACI|nr:MULTISPECIES: DUF4282 domain-containing protein [Bacillaceae]MBU9724246.1 DUF4282 domain-containing protein [Bacillus alkalicola]